MSTEQTDAAREFMKKITTNVQISVDNNKAHATVTTNAWKDAMFTIEQAAKSLGVLLFQLQNFSQTDAATIISNAGVRDGLQSSIDTLGNMSLVFHTDTRWKMLKKARDALQECLKNVNEIDKTGSTNKGAVYSTGQRDNNNSSNSGVKLTGNSNRDILNAPMPVIQKGTVTFNPSAGSELKTNTDGTFEKPYLGTSIKPTNKLTFSSAESSASARLGISGKCALCNAPRDAKDKFCTGCGKASNIIF